MEISVWILLTTSWVVALFSLLYGVASYMQFSQYRKLRKTLLQADTPMRVLDEEMLGVVTGLRTALEEGVKGVDTALTEASRIAKQSEQSAEEQVEQFKSKLNATLGMLKDYLAKLDERSGNSLQEARETRQYVKEVAEMARDSQKRVAELEEGFHIRLLRPVVNSYLDWMEQLEMLTTHLENAKAEEAIAIRREAEEAVAGLGIYAVDVPKDPSGLPSKYWEAFPAPRPTSDPTQVGLVAGVKKTGYVWQREEGNERVVVRKAVVVRYALEDGAATTEEGDPSGGNNPSVDTTPDPVPVEQGSGQSDMEDNGSDGENPSTDLKHPQDENKAKETGNE